MSAVTSSPMRGGGNAARQVGGASPLAVSPLRIAKVPPAAEASAGKENAALPPPVVSVGEAATVPSVGSPKPLRGSSPRQPSAGKPISLVATAPPAATTASTKQGKGGKRVPSKASYGILTRSRARALAAAQAAAAAAAQEEVTEATKGSSGSARAAPATVPDGAAPSGGADGVMTVSPVSLSFRSPSARAAGSESAHVPLSVASPPPKPGPATPSGGATAADSSAVGEASVPGSHTPKAEADAAEVRMPSAVKASGGVPEVATAASAFLAKDATAPCPDEVAAPADGTSAPVRSPLTAPGGGIIARTPTKRAEVSGTLAASGTQGSTAAAMGDGRISPIKRTPLHHRSRSTTGNASDRGCDCAGGDGVPAIDFAATAPASFGTAMSTPADGDHAATRTGDECDTCARLTARRASIGSVGGPATPAQFAKAASSAAKAASSAAKAVGAVRPCTAAVEKAAAAGAGGCVCSAGAAEAVREFVVLESRQIAASDDAAAESARMQKGLAADDWAQQYDAIDSARRLAIHHTAVLAPLLAETMPKLHVAAGSLRSAMSRNALCAIADVFEHMAAIFPDDCVPATIGVLLRRAAHKNKFICKAATAALEQLVVNASSGTALLALTSYARDKAPVVVCSSAVYAQMCAAAMGGAVVEVALVPLVTSLGIWLGSRLPDGRNAARRLVMLLLAKHGVEAMNAAIKGAPVSSIECAALRKEVARGTRPRSVPNRASRSGGMRLSLRERMMASRGAAARVAP